MQWANRHKEVTSRGHMVGGGEAETGIPAEWLRVARCTKTRPLTAGRATPACLLLVPGHGGPRYAFVGNNCVNGCEALDK